MNMNDKVWPYYRDEMPDEGRERWSVGRPLSDPSNYVITKQSSIIEQCDYPHDSQWCYVDDDEKPQKCPECGNATIHSERTHLNFGQCICLPCGLRGPMRDSEQGAVIAWNRIRIDDELDEMREILASDADSEDALINAAEAKE